LLAFLNFITFACSPVEISEVYSLLVKFCSTFHELLTGFTLHLRTYTFELCLKLHRVLFQISIPSTSV